MPQVIEDSKFIEAPQMLQAMSVVVTITAIQAIWVIESTRVRVATEIIECSMFMKVNL